MNASSVRDREREELQKLAKLAAESKAPKAPPPPTLSADSSGFVDLSALNLGNPNWIDEALRRTPRPRPPLPPPGASARKAEAPTTSDASTVAPPPRQPARESFPSDFGVEAFPRARPSLAFFDDGDDDVGLTTPPAVAGRPRRLAPFVATVFVLCIVLCGFALRRVVLNRAAEADAARAVVSAGPVIPPVLPDIPPPPPVSEVAPAAPPPAAAAETAAAAPAVAAPSKKGAAHGASKKKHAGRAPAAATATATTTTTAKPAKGAPVAAGPKSLDDAIQQSFAPAAKAHK